MSTDNTRFVDQFKFETREDGSVIAEDKEGYVIELDIGDIAEKETFDDASIKANWEEVICPIVHKQIYESGNEEEFDQLELGMDEFTNELVEVLESDEFDTNNIHDELDTEALDRHSKAVTEFLIHTNILEVENGNIQLLNLKGLNETGVMDADDAVVNKIIKWSGSLELVIDNLKEKRDKIEDQFDVLENRIDEIRESDNKLKEKMSEAREELYDVCDGRQLNPKKTKPDGRAVKAPDELESEAAKSRYIDKYNKIVRLKGLIREKKDTQVGPVVDKLDNVRRMFKDREDELDILVDQLREKAYQAEETPEIDDYEEFMNKTSDVITQFSKSLQSFATAADEVSDRASPDEVFGNEGVVNEDTIDDIENTAKDGLSESESAYDEARNSLEETNQHIAGPEPQNG